MIGTLLMLGYVAVATVPLVLADVREHRLPNAWTMPGWAVAAIALVAQWFADGRFPAAAALAGLAALALFGLLALVAGLGMGDVKLAVPLAVGLGFVGAGTPVIGLVVAFLLGGVAAVVVLVRERRRDVQLAFGPCLLAGYWLAAFI